MKNKQDNTVYLSVDIEADGPIPGVYSMLSIGAAAFRPNANTAKGYVELGTFKRNLKPLPDAKQSPDTMQWWSTQPEAWKAATEGAVDAVDAMKDFVAWVKTLPGPVVFCGYPVAYDFQYVYHYVIRFTGFPSPFGFQGLDIKTFAWGMLGGAYKDAAKRNMPKRWFKNVPPHTHDALDDAIGQGILFMNMLNDNG